MMVLLKRKWGEKEEEEVIRTCPCDVLILFKQREFSTGVLSVLPILASSAKRTLPRKVALKTIFSEILNKEEKKSQETGGL